MTHKRLTRKEESQKQQDTKKYLAVKGYKGNATDLKIPPTVTIDGNEYPVTEIGDCAFAECKSLESVTIDSKHGINGKRNRKNRRDHKPSRMM